LVYFYRFGMLYLKNLATLEGSPFVTINLHVLSNLVSE
jgi:hypothetical protein